MDEATSPLRTQTLRVAVVNDVELVTKGLQAMLAPFADRISVVDAVYGSIPAGSADIVLFDTFASDEASLARVAAMVADRSLTKIVLYTWEVDGDFASAARSRDVDAVVCKTTPAHDLVLVLERIHRGESIVMACDLGSRHGKDVRTSRNATDERLGTLSDREREVLSILAAGASNKEIADELFVSAETIKSHVRSILSKLGAKNRTEAALIARGAAPRSAGIR